MAPLAVVALATAACSGTEITDHDLSAEDESACAAFVESLPDTLADQARGEVDPDDALGAAYGDPPIVVTCGVPEPPAFGEGAACEVVDGVRWYLPEDQFGTEPQDLTLTSAWDLPRIEVVVPAAYWPEGGAAVMASLGPLVDEHLRRQPGECR